MSQIIKFIAQHVLVRQMRAMGIGAWPITMILILLVSGVHGAMTRSPDGPRMATTGGEVTRVKAMQSSGRPRAMVSFKFLTRSGDRYRGYSTRTLDHADDVAVGDKITVTYRVRKPSRNRIVALTEPAAGIMQKPRSEYWSQLNKPKIGSDSGTSVIGYLLYGGIIAYFMYRIFVSPLLRVVNFLARMWHRQDEAVEPPMGTAARQQETSLADVTDTIASYGRRAATLTGPARTKPMPGSMLGGTGGGGGGLASAVTRSSSLRSTSRNNNRYASEASRYKSRPAQPTVSRHKSSVKTRAGWFD